MPVFILYLLKLSISISAVYLFYRLLLQRLTFYRYNRWYLLVYPVCCCCIPFVDVAPLLTRGGNACTTVVSYIPAVQQWAGPAATLPPAAAATGVDGWLITVWILGAGMLLLLCRLLLQWLSFRRIRRRAVLLNAEGVALYGFSENIMPFSFANGIYLNPALYTQEELQEIIRHEYVHVRQKHTIDILLGELLCMLNWYNPFAWLLRHAIRQNLEFIADHAVLHNGTDKKAYQYLLLKVVGKAAFRVANQFNFSSLKKRIVMMNRIKSARVHLLKFLFVLPMAAVLLLAFRNNAAPPAGQYNAVVAGVLLQDTLPPAAVMEADAANTGGEAAARDFVKRHPKVKNLRWGQLEKVEGDAGSLADRLVPGPILLVYFKNGKNEVYYLNSKEDVGRFKKNYGELPPQGPPPPPPAAPPAPAAYPAAAAIPAPPAPAAYPAATAIPDPPAPAAYPAAAAIPAPPAPAAYPAGTAIPALPPNPAKAAYPAAPPPPYPAKVVDPPAPPAAPTGGSTANALRLNPVQNGEVTLEGNISLEYSSAAGNPSMPLVMLNGKEQPAGHSFSLKGRFTVKTFDAKAALCALGEKAANGAIVIEGK